MKNIAADSSPDAAHRCSKRLRITFKGLVQGVGFRPFIYRCAKAHGLTGFVKNTGRGVLVEVEGDAIEAFLRQAITQTPPLSRIDGYRSRRIPERFSREFTIVASEGEGAGDVLVSADVALCDRCREELFSPGDRRHLYPFINCTDCGPRFTIIEDLPYDRPKTTMKRFEMCPLCREEYARPIDRRYHAQPISCHDCGPRLRLLAPGIDPADDPVTEAVAWLRSGRILAVKGLGGYHLACLAGSEEAVARLRRLKRRERKPFALMGTLEMIERTCVVSEAARILLVSPSAPIVLMKRRSSEGIAPDVAPGASRIGFMVPYTPLHLMLLNGVERPLVMTSANRSDDPIIYRDDTEELLDLADAVLTHDRPIRAFADDSVTMVDSGEPYPIRRSRGLVPLPLDLPLGSRRAILGLGAMLKTTFTILFQKRAIPSQYIGNSDSPGTLEAMRAMIEHYGKLFRFEPEVLAVDRHPDYPNRLLIDDFPGAEVVEIQHHRAHIGSLMAEAGLRGKMIGVAMDGTGYGDDGTIWGGEFFLGDPASLKRFGHLRYFDLPGGEQAIREPWRLALSLLVALNRGEASLAAFAGRFGDRGERVLEVIRKGVARIPTSSCGRLFDAVASLIGLGDTSDFDGDLPARLQEAAEKSARPGGYYPYKIGGGDTVVLDLFPLLDAILDDRHGVAERAFIFHATLARAIADMAQIARDRSGVGIVGLSGGVFQNLLLLSLTRSALEDEGFEVVVHRQVPANDGGVSLGQVFLAAAMLEKR